METLRELYSRWDTMTTDERKRRCQQRVAIGKWYFKQKLKAGDKLRAVRAECHAKEATFTFSHWEGDWIVSISGRSISPGMIYSVNGRVFSY